MDIKLSHTFLPVDDPDKAVEFYRDVLGLEVRNDVGYEKMRWITVGSPTQPEVDIVLQPPAANPAMSEQDKEAIADLMAKGFYGAVVFWTDSCDATFEHVSAAGADVLQEPTDQPYGVRDCAFRDPAGNMVRFAEAKS
ncbi:VOC family protein [Longispora albida]|uniref:VOC family protein n=1 Tax=Longispora albida TaxID=203523 RepID=UPI00035CF317|nr:VOC family protein [Longispora albida]